jgi:hypothetical protein
MELPGVVGGSEARCARGGGAWGLLASRSHRQLRDGGLRLRSVIYYRLHHARSSCASLPAGVAFQWEGTGHG